MKRSIFVKLITSFVLYAITFFFTFIFCIVIESFVISGGDPDGLLPGKLYDSINKNPDISAKYGCWIEELDEDGNVVAVYGEKMSQHKSYTFSDIADLTSPYGNNKYIGYFCGTNDSGNKLMCMYKRDFMASNPTIPINVSEKGKFPVFWVMFISFSLIEVFLICRYLKREIKYPLDRIIEGMERLKSGNDDARISLYTEAEFQKIVSTFNLMADKLKNEKNEKKYLENKKNQMLLELSHDLKTPVATIKSYANALEEGLVPEEKIKETYRIIDTKAERVKKLTDDMFMMLKMDNPDYKLNTEITDISEYLRRICAEHYSEMTDAGFKFEIDIPENKINADIDTELFSRVIENLLSNAKKYNRTGDTISVKLFAAENIIYLTVSDDGEKIEQEVSEQMFNAFSRGDKARKTDGGTGLGLAISKIITEKHNGGIKYFYENGKNIFRIELPFPK